MLSPLARIASMMCQKRKALSLSQRQVAVQVGCSQSYIAQIETGVRPISKQLAARLERLFKVATGIYQRATFLRGRPRLTNDTRSIMKQIRQARGLGPRQFSPLGKPKYPRADRVPGLKCALGPLARQLERQRGDDERFWRNLNSIRFDSLAEKQLCLRLASSGAQLVGASLGSLGCALPVMDGASGRDKRRKPFPTFLLRDGDVAVACSPQRCVRTAGGYRWPDHLLVVAYQGRKITAAVEVDGAPYHNNAEAETWRDKELGIPVLHLDAAEVGHPKILERIFGWIRELG